MKFTYLILLITTIACSTAQAQKVKPEKLTSIKEDDSFHANVYAREIAKSIGLNKSEEQKIANIQKKYDLKLQKMGGIESKEQIAKMNTTRDIEITDLLDEKKSAKYKEFLLKQR